MSPSTIPISNPHGFLTHDFISAQPQSNSNGDVFQRIAYLLLPAIFISPPPPDRPYIH